MDSNTVVQINVHVIEPVAEYIRCVQMANGRIVYEFNAGTERISRVDADVYDEALMQARAKMQYESTVQRVEVPRAS